MRRNYGASTSPPDDCVILYKFGSNDEKAIDEVSFKDSNLGLVHLHTYVYTYKHLSFFKVGIFYIHYCGIVVVFPSGIRQLKP